MTTMDFVAATLAWCNEKRREQGKEPLDELPKGYRRDPQSCPCGEATGLYVDANTYGLSFTSRESRLLPAAVAAFVSGFDAGKYPQYDADAEDVA